MKLQLKQIAELLQARLLGNDAEICGVSIDTRMLQKGELYIALKGKNFDGHAFVDKAAQAGAVAVVVEQSTATHLPQIIVEDTHLALAELAGFWRKQLPVQVIGVTGSNGKTTVKEMLAAILATKGNTLYTQGNLNNDIGVPLTLCKMTESHLYAVVEMGANHAGEIAYTSRYAQADVALITNVGPAHIEGFGDIDGVAKSKGEIITSLSQAGVAVLNRDDAYYHLWRRLAGDRKTVSFGLSNTADVYAENIVTSLSSEGFETSFTLNLAEDSIAIKLSLAGEHNVKNAIAAAAASREFGFKLSDIKQGLEQVKPVIGRMQALLGRKGNTVIDDTYNANPASLKAALSALSDQNKNWLILGAFGELGENSSAMHSEMGLMIKTMPIKRLFATGADTKYTVESFGSAGEYFESQEQLIIALNQAVTGCETLLVKGSRSQKMENVVAAMVDNFRAA